MRFLFRAIAGFVLVAISLALLAAGGWRLMDARESAGSKPSRPPAERSYAVELADLKRSNAAPEIALFGEVITWRSLELRAPSGGAITRLAGNFRDGETVTEGSELLRVDPGDAKTRVAESEVTLSQARVDESEARAAVKLVQSQIGSAERQFELRQSELERQRQLLAKGVVARVAVENAELAVSSAEQSLTNSRQQLSTAMMRVDNAALGVERARIGRDDSGQDLSETALFAPFSGRLSDVSATDGRRVSPNEKLGLLIDPTALEVKISVRDDVFGRLIDDAGQLAPLKVQVALSLGERNEKLTGTLHRDAATVSAADGGRTVFARLDVNGGTLIRPGDFVDVTIFEPELSDIATLPASAVTQAGQIYLVDDENRLEQVTVTVLRRFGDQVLASDVPWGRKYVTVRLPQLGNGVKVKSQEKKSGEPEKISLSDERRARLVDAVKNNRRMPKDVQSSILKRLEADEVPASMVERIESRMGKRGGKDGKKKGKAKPETSGSAAQASSDTAEETIALDPARRDKLIEFVKSNTSMPEDRRARILERLSQPEVPLRTVERIESRMGG